MKKIITAITVFTVLFGTFGIMVPTNVARAQSATVSVEKQAQITALETEIKGLMQQLITILQGKITDLTPNDLSKQAQITSLETQIKGVMQQLITLLQSKIAAYALVPGFPSTGFSQ